MSPYDDREIRDYQGRLLGERLWPDPELNNGVKLGRLGSEVQTKTDSRWDRMPHSALGLTELQSQLKGRFLSPWRNEAKYRQRTRPKKEQSVRYNDLET